jgi:hypothetical protein
VAALANPHQIPLEFNLLATKRGRWVIRVNAVMADQESDNLALQLVLQNLEDERTGETRRLYAVVPESDLDNPQQRVLIADRIRHWIETTDGNGFLDLASSVALFPG